MQMLWYLQQAEQASSSTGSDGKVLSSLQKKEFELVPLKPAFSSAFFDRRYTLLFSRNFTSVCKSLQAKAGQKSYDTKGGLLYRKRVERSMCYGHEQLYYSVFSSEVALYVDFVPNISMSSLEQTLFAPSKKQLSTRLSEYIPQRLANFCYKIWQSR